MIFIWGTRLYGSVKKCDDISVKTSFGHLWYLPFIPKFSYYTNSESDSAYRLRSLDGRSVTMSYLRAWLTMVALVSLFLEFIGKDSSDRFALHLVLGATILALIISYLWDKRNVDSSDFIIRSFMNARFGAAIDPFLLETDAAKLIANTIDGSAGQMAGSNWYLDILNGALAEDEFKLLAVLRMRCCQEEMNGQVLVKNMLNSILDKRNSIR